MPRMNARGFTLVETLIVLGAAAVLMALGFPKMRSAFIKSSVRGARSSVMALYNQSRARAVREGRRVTLRFNTSTVWVTASPRRTGSATCNCDTVGTIRNLTSLYGVTVAASPDSFQIDPRGLGVDPSSGGTAIRLTRSGMQDSILISGYGRVSK